MMAVAGLQESRPAADFLFPISDWLRRFGHGRIGIPPTIASIAVDLVNHFLPAPPTLWGQTAWNWLELELKNIAVAIRALDASAV